jgi:hypothetical protein
MSTLQPGWSQPSPLNEPHEWALPSQYSVSSAWVLVPRLPLGQFLPVALPPPPPPLQAAIAPMQATRETTTTVVIRMDF